MGMVKIDQSLCKGCMLCVENCSRGCLQMSDQYNDKGYLLVEFSDPEAGCNGCTMCAVMCPDLALSVYK